MKTGTAPEGRSRLFVFKSHFGVFSSVQTD